MTINRFVAVSISPQIGMTFLAYKGVGMIYNDANEGNECNTG